MANLKSAKKRMRQNPKRQMRNKRIRTRARTFVKNAREAIDDNPVTAEASTAAALRELDKAASRGVIHRNNASRRKSRLMKHLSRAQKNP
ncbi:MAG: 30S ribosomal protein S20 [Anaerolineales bacterium]|nr:30S ribosomal protein S20 [Anaerolineales bacterium]